MKPTIRPFTPEDYPATVAVTNAATPEYPRIVEEIEVWNARRDPFPCAATKTRTTRRNSTTLR